METKVERIYVGNTLIKEIVTQVPEEGGEPVTEVKPAPKPVAKEAADLEPGTSARIAQGARSIQPRRTRAHR